MHYGAGRNLITTPSTTSLQNQSCNNAAPIFKPPRLPSLSMGSRNCALEGCNAMEFRTTGVCNKHQGMSAEVLEVASEPEQVEPEQQSPTGEEFECPRGCGTMSYEDIGTALSGLPLALFFGIPLLAGIYFIGSFVIFHPGDFDASQTHPSVGVLLLFAVAWIANLFFGSLKSENHVCQSCNGIMLDDKTMSHTFSEESLVKINSMIDDMAPSSSDLQCPVCDEKMGTFSIPYIPIDDFSNSNRVIGTDIGEGVGRNIPDNPLEWLEVAIIAIVPNKEETIDLDACGDCRVVWFDGSEKDRLGFGTIN